MRHSLLSSRIWSSSSLNSTTNLRSLPVLQTSTFTDTATLMYSSTNSVGDSSSSSATATATAFDDKYTTFQSYSNSFLRSSSALQQRDPVKAYPLTPKKTVSRNDIMKPPYADKGIVPPHDNTILLFSEDENLEKMRHAAKIARRILDYACKLTKPGVTTDEVDTAVHEALLDSGVYPSPLNYMGFPKSLCSSINEVICHGIPDGRPVRFGDIVSFDVSCFVNGVHGDNCATIIVGDEQDIDEIGTDWRGVPYLGSNFFDGRPEDESSIRKARRLVHATRESLYEAINRIGPSACLTDIGAAIQDVADSYGYSTVEKYRGHGISSDFHRPPFVKHYRNDDKLELLPGMIFTIEPMLVEGAGDCFEWADQWTVATTDGGMAAQFEHTILIREDGVEILTVPE